MSNRVYLITLLLSLITALVLIWHLASNEIYYLCGNFTKGVTEQSVRKQLDTANLSFYEVNILKDGKVITFKSNYTARLTQCVITIDQNNVVQNAIYKTRF